MTDAKGEIYFFRNYQYDSSGNILENRLYGCLTGRKKVPLVLNSDKLPSKECECEVKTNVFSRDGFNLKLSEKDSQGVTTLFRYEPGTDRLMTRLMLNGDRVFSREFFEYDENHAVSKKIVDDGHSHFKGNMQGVTKRHVTKYKNRTSKPIGLPEEETHYYVDLESLRLQQLKRLTSLYTKEGWLEKQDIYDTEDQFRYSQEWERDKHGDVIKEVNPVGEVISKKYDSNDNLIVQCGPCLGYRIENSYDYMNRLIQQKEIHPNGESFETNYAYDYLGNCVSQINPYGLETRFKFDDFNRRTATYHPGLKDEKGNRVQPVSRVKYNVVGYPISLQDPAGNETISDYNVGGQPIKITYADGTFEKFFYRFMLS